MTAKLPTYAGLDIKVQSLETDVRDLKRDIATISSEMRSAFSALTQTLNERSRTPWVSITSAASVLVVTMGFIGSLALSPIQTDIAYFKRNAVTQTEFSEYKHSEERFLEAQRAALQRDADTERLAVTTSLDRLFAHLEALQSKMVPSAITPQK